MLSECFKNAVITEQYPELFPQLLLPGECLMDLHWKNIICLFLSFIHTYVGVSVYTHTQEYAHTHTCKHRCTDTHICKCAFLFLPLSAWTWSKEWFFFFFFLLKKVQVPSSSHSTSCQKWTLNTAEKPSSEEHRQVQNKLWHHMTFHQPPTQTEWGK